VKLGMLNERIIQLHDEVLGMMPSERLESKAKSEKNENKKKTGEIRKKKKILVFGVFS
jgi:hypothetical protein